jgi:hypothetical protein
VIKRINIINCSIWLSSILIIINFFNFVIERSSVQYSDWLINYQAGFVRRGFIGEFYFKIYEILNIPLDVIVFFFVSSFYVFFSIILLKILKKTENNFLNKLILFSPISFFYPVMEQKISGRKDILFILSTLILVFFLEKIKFKNQKYLIIFLTLITTFSHSGFFVYIPIFFLVFIIINYKKNFKKLIKELFLTSLYCAVLFFLIIFNSSVPEKAIMDVCISIEKYLPNCGNSDYISTLNWSLKYEIDLVRKLWGKENYIRFYSVAFILANAPLIYAFYNSKIRLKPFSRIEPLLVFVLISLITFPIYYIGADYGRYMHITYLSLMVIYFKSISNKFLIIKKKSKNFNKFLIFLIIFLFGFTWTIPHCCENDFKFIYKKPITKLIDYNKN